MHDHTHWRYRLISTVLTLAFMIQLLPVNVFAAETEPPVVTPSATAEPVTVVAEVTENRTEYSKEFKLSNGLHMAAVYADPVHYEADGQWQEIDNTLRTEVTGEETRYVNKAGIWSVSFPQSLADNQEITVRKGDYALGFQMSGELRSNVGQLDAEDLVPIQAATAQLQQIDYSAAREAAEYPETVYTKGHSQIRYNSISGNASVVYDLHGNTLKESVILDRYDAGLVGYSYLLRTEGLTPVLQDDGQILLQDQSTGQTVMVMPAPYLVDNAGVRCDEVEIALVPKGGGYILLYALPKTWLADSTRQWPVVLDPVIYAQLTTSNIRDVTVNSSGNDEGYTDGSIECGVDSDGSVKRIFLKYNVLPVLKSSDVIVSASLSMNKLMTSDGQRLVTVHKLSNTWESESVTWAGYFGTDPNSNHDTTVVDYLYVKNAARYTWDITDIVRGWYAEQNTGLLLRYGDETDRGKMAQFASSDYSGYAETMPALVIQFRNNNGLEGYWDYTTLSAGRAGSGYINNYTGNLVWVRGDLGFGGNLMPVSISHVYNANDTQDDLFGLGFGWRTNFNQRVREWSQNGISYYLWEDSDGTHHYFYYDSGLGKYRDEDGLELTLEVINTAEGKYLITDKNGNCSYFDTLGRLVKQENNQQETSKIAVTYTDNTNYRISTVIDGANRKYAFTYTDGLLTRIEYLSKGTTAISHISYSYNAAGELTGVTDADGKSSTYTYTQGHLLESVRDIDGYKLAFGYTNLAQGVDPSNPARVATVAEYQVTSTGSTAGGSLTIVYAHNQTTLTDIQGNKQILQFNNWGNTVAIQDDLGRAQYASYATDSGSGGKANQLTLASKLQNTVSNLIPNSSYELPGTASYDNGTSSYGVAEGTGYHGGHAFYVASSISGYAAAVHDAVQVQPNETVTFSAYVLPQGGAARLALYNGSSYVAMTPRIDQGEEWVRQELSYTNNTSSVVKLRCSMAVSGSDRVYIDCVQMEVAPTASRYTLVENGDFRDSTAWSATSGITDLPTGVAPAAPQLDNSVYRMTGNPGAENRVSQIVHVGGSQGDTFVLSGWAKGDSAPLRDDRKFSLIATFLDSSGNPLTDADGNVIDSVTVDFNPDADSSIAWQYVASALIAPGEYDSIKIELAYDYNVNTVYFDGIQLYKEQFGQSYTYDENGNIVAVKDIQGQETRYVYNKNTQDLIYQTLPNGAVLEYTYDNWHNPVTATSGTGVAYSFTYDIYGNNTSVTVDYDTNFDPNATAPEGEQNNDPTPPEPSGDGITASVVYTTDGNRLVSSTDALGNTTTYSYNADTNVLEWVQYPQDSIDTRTYYTYDSLYRMATSEAISNAGSALSVQYTYDNDLLTAIQTPSTTYSFDYGDFGLRENIRIGSRVLAAYSYSEHTNYLTALDYGNGDRVQYTYDLQGRTTAQAWEDGDTVTYAYDNSGGLASVYDSATGRTTKYYYDFTDRLMKYAVTGNSFSHSVEYKYDATNKLLELVETANGTVLTTSYTYDKDNRVTSISTTNGTATVTEEYTYDDYGRLTQKVTKQNGSVVLTETYTYKENNNYPTTQVATLTVTNGSGAVLNQYQYSYDGNGNITSISEGSHTTTYVYDSANQLIRENNSRQGYTRTWDYDDAGNIETRTEYAYTTGTLGTPTDTVQYGYGDASWGDLLKNYNGRFLGYDAIGNLTGDGAWTYTWEHGRQLASMTGNGTTWNYTYDADGMRTSRSSGSTTYSYIYNGGQLTQMTVGSNTLSFTYDATGNPQTVTYDNTTYYYAVNLQGDVVAILNGSGNAVVSYAYDAWGNILSTTGELASTLGALNPLRYRGYVYDAETQLYYLQSRYYNPETGRFINADVLVSTGQGMLGNNMFAYCGNNPVMRGDYAGNAYTRVVFRPGYFLPSCFSENVPQDVNCYNYVLGLYGNCNPGDYSITEDCEKMYADGKTSYTVEEVAAFVIRDLNSMGKNAYTIKFPSDVPEGYYVIAVKTSDIISDNIGKADYHFAVMIGDYLWADKQGGSNVARCGAIISMLSSWDKPDAPNYYNSPTIYIAVEGRWTPKW